MYILSTCLTQYQHVKLDIYQCFIFHFNYVEEHTRTLTGKSLITYLAFVTYCGINKNKISVILNSRHDK